MTIGFLGDPHTSATFARHGGEKTLGINRRGHLTLDVFQRAVAAVEAAGAKHCVILGDLVDTMVQPPQLFDHLRRILKGSSLGFYILTGNHDQNSAAPRDNAISVLEDDNVVIVDQPRAVELSRGRELLLIPFQPGKILKWLPEVLAGFGAPEPGTTRTLCLHAGVKTSDTAPWLQTSGGAIALETLLELMETYGIQDTFNGDWHDHKVMAEGRVHQVGALCPVGYQNLGISEYGNVAIRHPDGRVKYTYIPGPRFLQFEPEQDADAIRAALSIAPDNQYFIEWTVHQKDFESASETLRAFIAEGVVVDGSVVADTAPAAKGLEQGMESAKRADGIQEATSLFVQSLQLSNGVSKDSVLQRSLKYLGV